MKQSLKKRNRRFGQAIRGWLRYTGGITTPMPTRGPGIIITAPPGIITKGAFKLIMASPVRFIIGDWSEIDPGVMLIVLIPKQTLRFIPIIVSTFWVPSSSLIF